MTSGSRFVAGLDVGDDWQDERVWPKANPSLPSLPGSPLPAEQVEEAKAMPSRQSIVRRLNFCEWVECATTWLDMAKVRACAVPPLDLAAFAGQSCIVGIDIGATESLTVVALVFRAAGRNRPRCGPRLHGGGRPPRPRAAGPAAVRRLGRGRPSHTDARPDRAARTGPGLHPRRGHADPDPGDRLRRLGRGRAGAVARGATASPSSRSTSHRRASPRPAESSSA